MTLTELIAKCKKQSEERAKKMQEFIAKMKAMAEQNAKSEKDKAE